MSGQDQYGDYDYTRRSSGTSGEYEGQQEYNGRGGEASQYGSRAADPSGYGNRAADPSAYGSRADASGYGSAADQSGYGTRRAESGYSRGSADPATYGTRAGEQQAGEYGQPAEYGTREYRSYRRGEYRPRSDYTRSGEYPQTQTGYGRRGADGTGGGEPPRSRGDVIGVIASSLFAVLAVLALVAVVYIVLNGNEDESPTSATQASQSNEPTGSNQPSEPPAAAEKAPVIVLNSTDRSGIAADATEAIKADDWETGEPGNYEAGELAQTTVFYPEGMKGSAQLLQEQFPDITAVKPAKQGMSTSSLTLVLGTDWP
ncbi:MAG TPA: LytR C-terminal domain-containing protein [Actinomycetes bacterium]|nr:LytR C-terminal domain-containing protein [Actinomycetes bacterium]